MIGEYRGICLEYRCAKYLVGPRGGLLVLQLALMTILQIRISTWKLELKIPETCPVATRHLNLMDATDEGANQASESGDAPPCGLVIEFLHSISSKPSSLASTLMVAVLPDPAGPVSARIRYASISHQEQLGCAVAPTRYLRSFPPSNASMNQWRTSSTFLP